MNPARHPQQKVSSAYLIWGPEGSALSKAVADLKARFLSPESLPFDSETLYASKLNPDDLRRAFLALPVLAERRFVVIQQAHRLSAENKRIFKEFFSSQPTHVVGCCVSSQWTASDAFVRSCRDFLTLIQAGSPARSYDLKDLMEALRRRQTAESLKILYHLNEEGIPPVLTMGWLVGFWGRCQARLGRDRFEKGLRVLQQTDTDIKRSRMPAEFALETAVVKLSHLLGEN